jgi:hypothetical protein
VKILFIGTTGVHHTLVAANIFLGRLDEADFTMIKGYADNYKDLTGFPILISDDGNENQVYTLGVGRELKVAHKAINQFIELLDCSSKDLIVQPVTIKGETLLLLLKKIPEYLGGKIIGPFISSMIIKKQFSHILKDVSRLKEHLR